MASAIPHHKASDHVLPSADGESQIFIRHYLRGTPRIHFLIVHGAVEHSGRHQDLVHFWLKQYNDVAITVFDHIGHGRSGGPRSYVESFRIYVNDLLKVGEFIQEKNLPDTQTFICAHSLGGLITLTRFLDTAYGWPFPTKGLIFSSPCIRPKMILGMYSQNILEKMDLVTPRLRLPMIYNGADLTRDPDRANDFDIDSLIPKYLTIRMCKEIISSSARIRGLSYYLKTPSLFLVAGADRIVDAESTILFAHGIDKRLTQVIQYPQHYHELWNEIDRQDIFKTMKVWVEKRLKETP